MKHTFVALKLENCTESAQKFSLKWQPVFCTKLGNKVAPSLRLLEDAKRLQPPLSQKYSAMSCRNGSSRVMYFCVSRYWAPWPGGWWVRSVCRGWQTSTMPWCAVAIVTIADCPTVFIARAGRTIHKLPACCLRRLLTKNTPCRYHFVRLNHIQFDNFGRPLICSTLKGMRRLLRWQLFWMVSGLFLLFLKEVQAEKAINVNEVDGLIKHCQELKEW